MLGPRAIDIASFQLLAMEYRSVGSLDSERRASAAVTSRNSSRKGPWVRVPSGARDGAGSPAAQSRATAKASTADKVPERGGRGLRFQTLPVGACRPFQIGRASCRERV